MLSPANKSGMYNISNKHFIVSAYSRDARAAVRDEEKKEREISVEGLIKTGNYLDNLASSLDLTSEIMSIIKQNVEQIAQSAEDIRVVNERNIKKLQAMRDELESLQGKYKIVEK